MPPRELRFGVMCDGPTLSEWQARCLDRLAALPHPPKLSLIIRNARPPAPKRPLWSWLGRDKFPYLAYAFYSRLFFHPSSDTRVDGTRHFRGVPSLDCVTELEGKFTERFLPDDTAAVRSHDLDFILRFGFNIIRGEILTVARFGVWSFHHGDEREIRGSPPGLWEIYLKKPVSGAILQRLTDTLDGGVVLRRGLFGTVFYSHKQTVDRLYFGGVDWPAQVCRDIQGGRDQVFRSAPSPTSAPIFRRPKNLKASLFMARLLYQMIRIRVREAFWTPKWSVGLARAPIEQFLQSPAPSPSIRIDAGHRLRFFADPFGMIKNNELFILCEEFDHRERKGKLAAFRVSGSQAVPLGRLLDSPYHLSYPFLFEWNGKHYCVPECSGSSEVKLFRATDGPVGWEQVAVLLRDISAVDSTLFHWNGLWWLACTRTDLSPNGNLVLYYAPEPLGPWKPHEQNPVKLDIRSSRPAGTPFVHKGELYRPAQDCSLSYGGGIVINRVLRLSPEEFEETEVARVTSTKDPYFSQGQHTLSSVGDFTLVDGYRLVFSPEYAIRKLARRALGRV